MSAAEPIRPIVWTGRSLRLLDQRALPGSEEWLDCEEPEEVRRAIASLAVRGAPALGIAGAYGTALAAVRSEATAHAALVRDVERAGRRLVKTRPTAVNLARGVGRVVDAARGAGSVDAAREAAVAEADALEASEEAAMAAIAEAGQPLVPVQANVLTHCNTGALACGAGFGTALGVIVAAHRAGKQVHVFVDETRPVLQGARLTAWELQRAGVPMTLVADAAAGFLLSQGRVDLVVVGADRIAANGDVANKVGTYPLAVLAREHGVPFVVVAPISTVDLSTRTGLDIPVETRDPEEVTATFGTPIAPEGTWALNPAFDVTSARLVGAIVTERGVVRPPYRSGLKRAVEAGAEGVA